MDHKNLLKIIGAGITGGYLAIRFHRPKKNYQDFLASYWALSIDVLRELETTLIETMLPRLGADHSSAFSELLDNNAEFFDKIKFFQQNLTDFNELALKAINRFYAQKNRGNLALASHRKIPGLDFDTVAVAVQEAFNDLERAFAYAIMANAPEDQRADLKERIKTTESLPGILEYYEANFPHFGSVLFDAFAYFESKVTRGQEQ